MARDHQVGKWLVEGLTALAYGAPPQSATTLRAAVGLETAYQILAIQAEYSLLGRFADSSRGIAFSMSSIQCRHCFGTVFDKPLPCPGLCGKDLVPDGTLNMFVLHQSATLRSDSSKLGLWFGCGTCGCLECGRQALSLPQIWCSSCGENSGNGELFIGPSRRSVEDEIKTIFRHEIAGYS